MSYSDIDEISIASAKAQILAWCAGMKLPALSWSERSLPMMMVNLLARIWNRVSIVAKELKTFTVEVDAVGDALEAWSISVYGPTHAKNPSSSAIQQITLTCATGYGPHTIEEGAMVVTDGVYKYSNTTHASLPGVTYPLTIAAGTPVVVPFVASQPGEAPGLVSPTGINRLVTTYLGVTLSNQTNLLPGANKESDDELHERNHTVWATRNPLTMTRDAYIYWARTVAEVRRVRVIDNNPRGEFTIDVVLAATSGTVGAPVVAEVSEILSRKVLASFFGAISIYAAPTSTIPLVGSIYLFPGTVLEQAQTAIRDALNALSIPIGGSTYDGVPNQIMRSEFEAAILNATVNGAKVVKFVELSNPPASQTIAATVAPSASVVFSNSALRLITLTE